MKAALVKLREGRGDNKGESHRDKVTQMNEKNNMRGEIKGLT